MRHESLVALGISVAQAAELSIALLGIALTL